MKVCSTVGCPNIHANAGTKCDACKSKSDQTHWAKTRAYSTTEHRTFRTKVLQRDPVCVICRQRPSTVADHYPIERTELIARGLNPNDPKYGRGVCKPDHDRSTATNHPAGWNDRTT